jgi:4-oxalocrotonate tautomerase
MPQVVITMRSGRSEDQVRALVREVTEAVASTVNVAPERVRVLVHELDGSRIAVGGVLSSDRPRATLAESGS